MVTRVVWANTGRARAAQPYPWRRRGGPGYTAAEEAVDGDQQREPAQGDTRAGARNHLDKNIGLKPPAVRLIC